MARIFLIVGVLGGVLGYFGYQEYSVGQGSTAEPAAVELSDLERGNVPDNQHLRIGVHSKIYPGAVYEYEQSSYASGEPTPSTKVNYTYYPIISYDHPYVHQVQALEDRYGDLEQVPDSEWPGDVGEIAVLVKTKKWKTIGAIPEDWVDSESVQGLVINRIESLSSEEEKLIKENFPSAQLDKVLLLEEDRKPSSTGKSLAQLGGGALLLLIGVVGFFKQNAG